MSNSILLQENWYNGAIRLRKIRDSIQRIVSKGLLATINQKNHFMCLQNTAEKAPENQKLNQNLLDYI